MINLHSHPFPHPVPFKWEESCHFEAVSFSKAGSSAWPPFLCSALGGLLSGDPVETGYGDREPAHQVLGRRDPGRLNGTGST